jgi:hypothetical protein
MILAEAYCMTVAPRLNRELGYSGILAGNFAGDESPHRRDFATSYCGGNDGVNWGGWTTLLRTYRANQASQPANSRLSQAPVLPYPSEPRRYEEPVAPSQVGLGFTSTLA